MMSVKFWQRILSVENQDIVQKNYDRQNNMRLDIWKRRRKNLKNRVNILLKGQVENSNRIYMVSLRSAVIVGRGGMFAVLGKGIFDVLLGCEAYMGAEEYTRCCGKKDRKGRNCEYGT